MSQPASTSTPIFTLSSELAEEYAALAPFLATTAGIPGHDHHWGDLGPGGVAARESMWRRALGALDTLAPEDDADELARDVLLDEGGRQLEYIEARSHHYELNTLASHFQTLPIFLDMMPLETPAQVDAVAARLEDAERALATYRTSLQEGLAAGRVVARRQVLAVLEQGAAHRSESSTFRGLAQRGAIAAPARAARLDRAAGQAVGAYEKLCGWLEQTYLPSAPEEDAVGAERYAAAARFHLGMDVDLHEAYAWGWEEVWRIEEQMATLADQIRPGWTPAQVSAALRVDPAWCAPDVDAFLSRMQGLQDGAVDRLVGTHFTVPEPIRAIDVRLAPPGGGPLGAYYVCPSEDFSRPGRVYYSLEKTMGIPWFHEISTAYHEGFPGHHLQLSTAMYNAAHLSRFQRLFAHNTGYAEGWALYAEHLMEELGFLEQPEAVLGKLINEVVRAWRIVIDIGLHLELDIPADSPWFPGETWSFDLAVEALRDRALLTHETAVANVVRYLGFPGQAITYKLGQREILRLREQHRRRPGFSLAAFHARVLSTGTVGLGVLRRRLDLVTGASDPRQRPV